MDQLRPLTKFASAETDDRWAREGPLQSSAWLWLEARRYENVRNEEAEHVHRRRYLDMGWNDEKTELYFQGRMGAEQAAAFECSVLRHAERVVLADDPFDPMHARQCDRVTLARHGAHNPHSAP